MAKKKAPQLEHAELRHRAEERLGESCGINFPSATAEDPLRLLHELQVHQIELEMQIAELRQARDAEAAAVKKYTDLYEFAPVGYLTLDRIGTILNANLTGSGLIGVERSRLIGRRFGQFITTDYRPAMADFIESIFSSPHKVVCEATLLKNESSGLAVQIEGVTSASGEECRIALIDISVRKRAEEANRLAREAAEALRLSTEAAETLRLAKESVEAAASTKNQFFANMSHELRTPMTGILGMLQLALEEKSSAVVRDYLEKTLGSARSLLLILNDILDMSKFEAGKLTLEEKPFSLRGCLSEAVDILTPEMHRKGLEFVISLAEEVPAAVAGDPARLRQILINLIGNAVKFSESGRIELRVSAGKSLSAGQREFTFAVTDSGIGIHADKQDLLFRTFSQVDASHTRRYGGTGLGLAICRAIVELMGGTISFVSEQGVGSTFSFTIPLGEVECEVIALSAPESLVTETLPLPEVERIPYILIAEDDSNIRQVLGAMFKLASNYKIEIVDDGRKAVELWEKGNYDLVLMDVQMPRLDGFEATREIRERERERGGHTPIIAMTAHARKEDEEMCRAAGMDAFISKPIDFNNCLRVIGHIIRQQSELLGRFTGSDHDRVPDR